MKTFKILDIGTNSIHSLMFEKKNHKILKDKLYTIKLGEGLHETGKISKPALKRLIDSLKTIKNSDNVSKILAFGTMCLRSAKNSKEILVEVKKETGIVINVISGKKEAEFSFLGATFQKKLSSKNILVFDIGGGSTEIILGNNKKIKKKISINLGSINSTERYLLSKKINSKRLDVVLKKIENLFVEAENYQDFDSVISIGGTVTTLTSMKLKMENYNAEIISKSTLTLADIDYLIDLLRGKSVSERKKICGLQAKRAEIILGGALITKVIMKLLRIDKISINDKGLRYGVLKKMTNKEI